MSIYDPNNILNQPITSTFSPSNAWTTVTNGSVGDYTWRQPTGLFQLEGANADIVVNGVSLNQTLTRMQEQLAILVPDAQMEQEWEDLRALREQYEAKLAECREKSRAWAALKRTST